MKHHYIDHLDKEHFGFVPNRDRWQFHFEDLRNADESARILTITKWDKNWERLFDFQHLQELTLHEPNKDQLAALPRLKGICRLRITHARPKCLEMLSALVELEELVLEYVSGVDDLGPLSALPSLRSVFFENLRRVRDFAGIAGTKQLKYLSIDGTLDWAQPIESLKFLAQLPLLAHLRLSGVRVLDDRCPLSHIAEHSKLEKVELSSSAFLLEDFAWLEAKRPDIEGAVQRPFWHFGGERRELDRLDYRAGLSAAELRDGSYSNIEIDEDGKRYELTPFQAYLLGKGERMASGVREKVQAKCAAHEERYRALVNGFVASG